MQSKGSEPQQPQRTTRPYIDQVAFNYTPSQFATSYAGSVMSGAGNHQGKREDDAHTQASEFTSYTADGNRLVRRERGRDFNVLSDTYSLPTDVSEWDRLDKQHRGITLGLGGLYPAPDVVRAILAPQVGITKRVVDFGCGTGIWCTEMAREFPHCEVLGVDLAPVPIPPSSLPPNCRFEMDDINLGLTHLRGQYEVVFARIISMGFKDFRKALADIEGCVKPGGILIWIEGDYDLYSGWPPVYTPFWSKSNPNGSFAQRVVYEGRRSACLGGSDLRTMEKLMDEGFWGRPLLDPNTCKAASLYLPIGTWCEGEDPLQTERLRYVGTLIRQDVAEVASTTQPLFIKVGWPKELTDRWADGMRSECQKDTLGMRLRIAWGRRREGPNLPAPALPESTTREESSPTTKYPYYEVFDTPEQIKAAAETRNRGKDIPAPPLASESTE